MTSAQFSYNVVSRWPIWLQTVMISTQSFLLLYPHALEIVNNDSTMLLDIPIKQCLPSSIHGKLDFAQRALAVQKLKDIIDHLDTKCDVIIFTSGITIDGEKSMNDLVYSKESISELDIRALYQVPEINVTLEDGSEKEQPDHLNNTKNEQVLNDGMDSNNDDKLDSKKVDNIDNYDDDKGNH
mgnify:CR=1 FL=1